jgi:hypothetical protein
VHLKVLFSTVFTFISFLSLPTFFDNTSSKALYVWLSGIHTRQSSIQNNWYQVSHRYSFILMMGTQSPETCREKKWTYREKLCTKLALFTGSIKYNYICTPSGTTMIFCCYSTIGYQFPVQWTIMRLIFATTKRNLKIVGAYSMETSILWDPIYIHQWSLQLLPAVDVLSMVTCV